MMTEKDWLNAVLGEIRNVVLDIHEHNYDGLFKGLRNLFEAQVEVTAVTSEVKNLIASLALTEDDLLRKHEHLRTAAIRRLVDTRYRILQEPL